MIFINTRKLWGASLLITCLLSCSHVAVEQSGEIHSKEKKYSYHYTGSVEVSSGDRWACGLTAIIYGGWCWTYLGMPNAVQHQMIEHDVKEKVQEKIKTEFQVDSHYTRKLGNDYILPNLSLIELEDNSKTKKASAKQSILTTPSPTPKLTPEAMEALRVTTFGEKPIQIPRLNGKTYYRAVEEYLENNANDPDSIEIEDCADVKVDDDKGWLVACKYRGKNGFGAMVLNAQWFVIRNGAVVNTLPMSAYSR